MKRLLSICILLIASVLSPMAPAHADEISTLLNADLGPIVLPPSHPRLSAAQQQVGADWTIANGYTGQGVSVVLMDGGIQSDHVQFDGRIIAEVCTQPAVIGDIIWKCKSDAGISEGMGTAEAGLDANGNPVWHGVGVSSSVLEFAPSVRLIMIKNGDALQGFDWIIANAKKYNIAAASMSFGNDGPSPRQTDYCNVPDWHQRFVAMRALGVIPVAATGNGGQLTGISHPACDPLVVSVGAVTPDDKIVSYSNISDRTTLLAPTEFETADTTSDKTKKDAWRDIFSGTSAATPVVAAMMAIGKSVAPNASVDDIISAARATGKSIDDVAVKDLRRVNFDKFVSNLLNIKPIPIIKSLSTSNPTKTSTTLTWTVENTPSRVRVTPGDQSSQLFDGKDGSIKIQKVAGSHAISVKVEALQADGTVTSTKNINVGFFIDGVTGWCNPTGNELAIDAPLMGHFEVLGPNKENPNLVDFGVGLQGTHLSCTYIEMSPLSTPEIAYIARLKASNSTDRHTIVIPKSFGTGGVIRVTNIDMDGNYSRIYSHIFSEGSFDLATSNGYEAQLARNKVDFQPELAGLLQESLLLSFSTPLFSQGDLNGAVSAALEKQSTARAAADKAAADKAAADKAAADKAAADKAAADKAAADKAAADKAAADKAAADKAAADKAAADKAAADKAAADKAAADKAAVMATKKKGQSTISCVMGKTTAKITGTKPKCPAGFKKK